MQEKSAHDAQCTPFLILSSQNLKIENKYVNKIDKTTQKGTDAARSLHINLRDTAAAYVATIFFQGGPRMKMKKSSENFCLQWAFFRCGGIENR